MNHIDIEKDRIRVRRRKKRREDTIAVAIVMIVALLLLISTVFCTLLFVQVNHMQKQVNTLVDLFQKEGIIGEEEKQDIFKDENNKDTEGSATLNPKEDSSDQDARETFVEEKTYGDEQIEGKKVYLTFDDGPSQNTEAILKILSQYKVKATFFVVGKTDEHSKAMYKKMVEEGHTVAMHSYSHQYATLYQSIDNFQEDFNEISDLIYETTDQRSEFYRFPGGSSNLVSKVEMTVFISFLNEQGITYFDWNVVNGDATGKTVSSSQMVSNVLDGIKQYESSVVLMHDAKGKDNTVKALPDIIKKLQKQKVAILSITDNTRPVQHVKADSVE